MSLDLWLRVDVDIPGIDIDSVCLFDCSYTHNITAMASEGGIYQCLWHHEERGITKAEQLIEPLSKAVLEMRINPARFKAHNPVNGWGNYDSWLEWCVLLLDACRDNPAAKVEVST